MGEVAARDVSEGPRRGRAGGPAVAEQWRGPDPSVEPTAPLDELINEESAHTVEVLEEHERERAAALAAAVAGAVAHAPHRVASASRRTLGAVMTTLYAGGAGAIGGALRSTGLTAGTGLGTLRRRKASGQPSSADSRRPVRRPARRLGAAALLALAVAAPAAASPAPWGALVGFSVDGTGVRRATTALPGDLSTTNALGPLPAVLPERGLTTTPGPGGLPVGLDSGADPAAAGLPLGGSDRSIPSTVLLAYHQAADRLAATAPGCQLQWTLLAGIGKVESNHARGWSGSAALTADGTATPAILGPVLDGSTPGTAVLPDTDAGRLDGNAVFDRAVGPMQFVPATWKLVGQDGNADGKLDPNNVFDAALATGTYLCADGRDLGVPATQLAAVLAYNPSADYARTVLAWASAYGSGAPVDLSMPIASFAGPPAITGGQIGSFPVTGSPFLPYADSEGGSTGSVPYADPEPPAAQNPQPQPQPQPPRPQAPRPQNPKPQNPTSQNPTSQNPTTQNPGGTPPKAGSGQGGGTTPPGTTPTQPKPAALTVTRTAISEVKATDATTGRAGLQFTVTVSASKASSALIRLRLADSSDLRVTGIGRVVALQAGSNSVTLDVDGGFLGDSGVDGPYRVTTTYLETDHDGTAATGASTRALGTETRSKTYSAADFAYYVPSIARIDARVTEFTSRGLVTGAEQNRLRALLREQQPDLAAVQAELDKGRKDGSVAVEAYTRLTSLVARHQHPSGQTPTPESSPAAAPPGRDPELAAGRSVR